MAITRAQYIAPVPSAPQLQAQPSGVLPSDDFTIGANGVANLTPTGVQAGTYLSANIQVASDGRILAAEDGSGGGGGGFPKGTIVLFGNANAPLGWQQLVTSSYDDVAIRITAGSGGGSGGVTPFSAAFTPYTPLGTCNASSLQVGQSVVTGSLSPTVVSTNQMATHRHTFGATKVRQYVPGGTAAAFNGFTAGFSLSSPTEATGNSQSHTHSFSGFANGGVISGTVLFNGTQTQQFRVRYTDMIAAVRS